MTVNIVFEGLDDFAFKTVFHPKETVRDFMSRLIESYFDSDLFGYYNEEEKTQTFRDKIYSEERILKGDFEPFNTSVNRDRHIGTFVNSGGTLLFSPLESGEIDDVVRFVGNMRKRPFRSDFMKREEDEGKEEFFYIAVDQEGDEELKTFKIYYSPDQPIRDVMETIVEDLPQYSFRRGNTFLYTLREKRNGPSFNTHLNRTTKAKKFITPGEIVFSNSWQNYPADERIKFQGNLNPIYYYYHHGPKNHEKDTKEIKHHHH